MWIESIESLKLVNKEKCDERKRIRERAQLRSLSRNVVNPIEYLYSKFTNTFKGRAMSKRKMKGHESFWVVLTYQEEAVVRKKFERETVEWG